MASPGQSAPGLYIVSSPIGNLGDVTLRALETLGHVERIYAEDTRVSRKLLRRYDVTTPVYSYHEHNAAQTRPQIISFLQQGGSVALMSDAGTPLVSDPGLKLVRAAIKDSIPVTCVPGACAATAALTVSGLPCNRFLFAGFMPAKKGSRRAELKKLSSLNATLIFYLGPSRLLDCLEDARDVLGNRPAVLARELTKKFEDVLHSDLNTLTTNIDGPPRGEMTLLIGPASKTPHPAKKERIKRYRKGLTAETVAALWLMTKGYRIKARRFKIKRLGEIDLVAQKGKCVVFVEVKSRANARDALEAITPTARKRLKRAGQAWMQRSASHDHSDIRFDAIAMQGLFPLRHVRNFLAE